MINLAIKSQCKQSLKNIEHLISQKKISRLPNYFHNKQQLLSLSQIRQFSIVTPPSKLHFIDHPRYGQVYPVATYDFKKDYFALPLASSIFLGLINSIVLYGTLISPIFTPVVSSFICNPVFILPSLYLNYSLHQKYYIYFFGGRSHIQNMYLKPSGKQVIVETRDGQTKEINNADMHGGKKVQNRHDQRLEFTHGANNFLYFKGNPMIYDQFVLQSILQAKFVDTKNVAYDYDVTQEFTWDFRELVQIKKKRLLVKRYYRPTANVLMSQINTKKWVQAKKDECTQNNKKILNNYYIFQYFSDKFINKNSISRVPNAQGKYDDKDLVTPEMIVQQKKKYEAYVKYGGQLQNQYSNLKSKAIQGGRRIQRQQISQAI